MTWESSPANNDGLGLGGGGVPIGKVLIDGWGLSPRSLEVNIMLCHSNQLREAFQSNTDIK